MRIANVFLLALLTLGTASARPQMTPKTTHDRLTEPFFVAGYLVPTNNGDEISGQGKIGPLWQRFMEHHLGSQIPHRADPFLTVVYSNYSSDEKGDYDYLLGARVSTVDGLAPGLSWKKVEPGTYAVILTEKGRMPGVLQAAWAIIWNMSAAQMGGRRLFASDYEIYDQRSTDPANAQVEIHIGVNLATDF
jgi:predicted transcriptional regulator YdeE